MGTQCRPGSATGELGQFDAVCVDCSPRATPRSVPAEQIAVEAAVEERCGQARLER
jgi:hypothetical protein